MGDSLYNDEDSTTVLVADDTTQDGFDQSQQNQDQVQSPNGGSKNQTAYDQSSQGLGQSIYAQQSFNQSGYNQPQNGYGQQNLNQNSYSQPQNSYGNAYGQTGFNQNGYNQAQSGYSQPQNGYGNAYGQTGFNQNGYNQSQNNYGNPYGQTGFNQNMTPTPAKEPKKPMDEAAKDKLHKILSLTALGIAGAGFIAVAILTLISTFFSATSDFKGSYKDSKNTTEAATEAGSTDESDTSASDDTSADGTDNASTEQGEQ
ncbi:uncharacterized protein BN781_01236 [Coprococcus sp. CAG:782]|nr:uncharacterized protein BN781_01236 [Coprococcus sp. CAG:782]